MNEDQMKELTKAAQLLRQAKARIDAVREAVDKEREGLPECLHSTEIEDDAEMASVVLDEAATNIEDALASLAEVTGEDDLKPPGRADGAQDRTASVNSR